MRASFFILLAFVLLGLFLWATLSGGFLLVGTLFWFLIAVITVSYSDTMILYFLGAREVRSSDEQPFFEAASQEAYKLAVAMPRLYFYNGSLERAFILQNHQRLSIILNKELLDKSSPSELKAISFGLLLQVKKRMASKRTKTMFLLGFFTWIIHALVGLILSVLPFKDLNKVINWTLNFLLHPTLNVVFKLIIGEGYFKKLAALLIKFPLEKELLDKVGLKLRKPFSYYSLPSRKLLELSSIYKSGHYQNIIALEFLPHEWDYLFRSEELKRAE